MVSNEEKGFFIRGLTEIMSHEKYDGWMFTTDDWCIGFNYPCEDCGGIVMNCTDLQIPYNSTNDQEFNDILNAFGIEYTPKAHWLYDDDSTMCHCGEEFYKWNENTYSWECIEDEIE